MYRKSKPYQNNIENNLNDFELKAKVKETDKQIEQFNKSNRRKTLQEIYDDEYKASKKSKADFDRKERIFEWERDMNSTVKQISSKSAKDLVSKSSLNDRFGSSSTKKYL